MNLWDQLLARIETKIGRHAFYTWFRPTAFVAEDRNSVTIRVPNPLFQDWLTKHYSGVIAEAMAEVLRPNLALHFVSDPNADAAVNRYTGSGRSCGNDNWVLGKSLWYDRSEREDYESAD